MCQFSEVLAMISMAPAVCHRAGGRWQDPLTAGLWSQCLIIWLSCCCSCASPRAAPVQQTLKGHSAQGNSFVEAASEKLAVLYCSLDAEKIGTGAYSNRSSILHRSPNFHYCCCKFPVWSGRILLCLQLPWPGLSPHSTTGRFKSSLCSCSFPLAGVFLW